ncbi:MAG: septation protein IspZ [Chitinispirillaceae bacterium]|nr:septation protein IspZ [Chitinispirillaceae bacterium]
MTPMLFLGQMLPLIVFIIVDWLFKNIRISIVSAVVFACGQLVFYYGKTGRFDWFVLLDVGLIIALGAVAIIFKNDLFFKVKPAVVESAAIVVFLALALSPDRFLLDYFGRMMPEGMVLRPEAIGVMKTILLWMCVYVLLHIGAVLYTAFYSSRRMWAFVSGPGFYLLFIPVMAVITLKSVRKRRLLRKGKV